LFNEPDTGFDILVASDAIGMGLNLNIRRIIFHTAVKPGYGKKNIAPRYIEPGKIETYM
jgi:ATP-dependent RNA helicase SUPV3L1/SUV3